MAVDRWSNCTRSASGEVANRVPPLEGSRITLPAQADKGASRGLRQRTLSCYLLPLPPVLALPLALLCFTPTDVRPPPDLSIRFLLRVVPIRLPLRTHTPAVAHRSTIPPPVRTPSCCYSCFLSHCGVFLEVRSRSCRAASVWAEWSRELVGGGDRRDGGVWLGWCRRLMLGYQCNDALFWRRICVARPRGIITHSGALRCLSLLLL